MDKGKRITEFLDSNIELFLSDILELPPKERAKAFLTLMARETQKQEMGKSENGGIWFGIEEWKKYCIPKTVEQLEQEIKKAKASPKMFTSEAQLFREMEEEEKKDKDYLLR